MARAQAGRPDLPGGLGFAVVEGRSMLPTLRPGDRLLLRYGAVPSPGGLVVVRLPSSRHGEPPVTAVKRALRRTPQGWWVERDNPQEGVDSWTVGPIRDLDVVATVVCRVWPPRRRPPRTAVRD